VQGLKTAIIEGHEIGGTCVNRGCVPSKALLAASGRVRDMRNDMHLKSMGIQVTPLCFLCVCGWEREHGKLSQIYDHLSASFGGEGGGMLLCFLEDGKMDDHSHPHLLGNYPGI